MPNTWGIEIAIQNGKISFRPDLPNAPIGQPLGVHRNDLVVWINRTDLTLALESIDPPGLFLTNPIPPGEGSRPFFVVTIPSITYTSRNSVHVPSRTKSLWSQ